jgi:hypothetical protein
MSSGNAPYVGLIKDWEEAYRLLGWDAFIPFLLDRNDQRFPSSLERWEAMSKRFLQFEWAGQLPALEAALKNFARIAQDLVAVFKRHAVMSEDDDFIVRARVWTTEKFHRPFMVNSDSSAVEEARFAQVMADHRRHVDLVRDLALELTRAANLVIDRVREGLNTHYREKNGHVPVVYWPDFKLEDWRSRPRSPTTMVVQYSREERDLAHPYPGLEEFLAQRVQRDLHFGAAWNRREL